MSIHLDDYRELLEDLAPASQEILRANWHDATRIFSPRGLDNYLKGAAALQRLGRGGNLVDAWIEETPQVARGRGGRRGGRSGDVRPGVRLQDVRRSDRTDPGHGADRRQAAGRCTAVPQLPAVPQYADGPGAARHTSHAGQAGRAAGAAHAWRPAPLGDVGRARPPHQLRGTDSVISASTPRNPWQSCRRSARAPCSWISSAASTCTCARCGRATSSCGRPRATSRRARATGPTSKTI